MIITVFTMCAIMMSGAYDCNEKWVIYLYEELDVFKYCYPGVKSFHFTIAGCAVFDEIRGHSIIVGEGGNGKSHTGHTVLWHEIKHLQCLCDFHANPPEKPRR